MQDFVRDRRAVRLPVCVHVRALSLCAAFGVGMCVRAWGAAGQYLDGEKLLRSARDSIDGIAKGTQNYVTSVVEVSPPILCLIECLVLCGFVSGCQGGYRDPLPA